MSVEIRPAERRDAPGIRGVHLAAFPTEAEADLVEALDRDRDAPVSLVVEAHGVIAGHIMLSRMRVDGDGRAWRALGLGPVAVSPELQRLGLGTALIQGALAIAEATGEEIVFVLGEPDYYERFGFSAATASPFASPYGGPFFMARLMRAAALPARGSAHYARAFSALEA